MGEKNKELIERIRRSQEDPSHHPLTCGNDSTHANLVAEEQEGRVVLVCPDCDYVQHWVPDV